MTAPAGKKAKKEQSQLASGCMALIKCIEFGHEIWNRATACPRCGCPLAEESSRPRADARKKLDQKRLGNIVAGLFVGALFVMLAMIFLIVVLPNASAAKEAKDMLEKLNKEPPNQW
jgi:hypothetical protein